MPKLLLLLLFAVPFAHAQSQWLTIMGDPANAAAETIQVDPAPVSVSGDHRTMRVRVSRSAQRVNAQGIPYRSFESTVEFDCVSNTARYLEMSFYMRPGWTGPVHKKVDYSANLPRWMTFRGIEPNPNRRIIRAACGGMGAGEAAPR